MTPAAPAVFGPELARLDALIHREILRLRARYELSLDELRGLYITDDHVDDLLRGHQKYGEAFTIPSVAAERLGDGYSRWHHLGCALGLSDDDRDILLICLAPEFDAKYETLYAYLNNEVSRHWPTIDLVTRLLGKDDSHGIELRGRLLPGAPLTACCAIEIVPAERSPSRMRASLRAAPPLADWLLGFAYVDDRLKNVARFGALEPVLPGGGLPQDTSETLAHVSYALSVQACLPALVITASSADEASLIAEDVLARAGIQALIVDLNAIKHAVTPDGVAVAIELLQRVLGVGIVASPFDGLLDIDSRPLEAALPLVRCLATDCRPILFAASRALRWRDLLVHTPAAELSVPDLETAQRAALWRCALGAEGTATEESPDNLVVPLADRFALGADRIFKAVQDAREVAALSGRPTLSAAQLFASARCVSSEGTAGATRRVATPFDWQDLILPVDIKERLAAIVSAIEMRSCVLDQWGFARRVGGTRGVKILFAGPSGTGKTMAATIIAKTLCLDLHAIELAAVMSKYIGDTEKNLDRVFGVARRANAILFIDEADALLSKRAAEVKDAHDRYANVETAYLLQKMEDHDGVVILASNLPRNIDEAFSRRMQFVVDFPLPDAESREKLWRQMYPPSAPLAADVDFRFLAQQFEFAGGDIRNIVLDAAFRAAQDRTAIGLGQILRAIARQYAKGGRIPAPSEFREHFGLLFDGAASASEAQSRAFHEATPSESQ